MQLIHNLLYVLLKQRQSTDTLCDFLAILLVTHKVKRKSMKRERSHHITVDKSSLKNSRHVVIMLKSFILTMLLSFTAEERRNQTAKQQNLVGFQSL